MALDPSRLEREGPDDEEARMAALAGMRVFDFTTEIAGPYATKLLADYGAAVLKVEPPGGDPARHEPPFFHDTPHVEGSLRFLHLNTSSDSQKPT